MAKVRPLVKVGRVGPEFLLLAQVRGGLWSQSGEWGRGRTHQSLLYQQAEQDGVAHFPQALEHVCFELCVLNDVLQLVVEELQDP